MEISVARFADNHENDWDKFIFEKAINATFLHSRSFYRHNPLNSKDDSSLLFFKKNQIVAVFPANLYERDGKKTLHSYMRSTYGGLIIGNELGTADIIDVVTLIKKYAADKDVSEVIVRPTFRIYHSLLADEVDYALWKCGFNIKYRELELAIDLSKDISENYSDSTKRSLKKALKNGITCTEDGDLEAFWQVLTENLREKHDAKPVHNIKEIQQLIHNVGADKVKLFTAELDGKTAGGILTFLANAQVVHAQYIASDSTYQELRPLNALIDFIAAWGKKNNFRYFNLGMASEPGGTEINAGLFRFKEGFGARGVLRETMHIHIK